VTQRRQLGYGVLWDELFVAQHTVFPAVARVRGLMPRYFGLSPSPYMKSSQI
jgi:hypothetical protein